MATTTDLITSLFSFLKPEKSFSLFSPEQPAESEKDFVSLFGDEIIPFQKSFPQSETKDHESVTKILPTDDFNAGSGIAVIDLGGGLSRQLERKPDIAMLRNYAKYSVWVRAAINFKREKIGRALYELVPLDSTSKPNRTDKRVRAEIEKLLRSPNNAGDSYGYLKEQLLEDYYVIGHGALELDLFVDTTVRGMRILDAARIGFIKNWDGKTPGAPRYAEFSDKFVSRVRRYLAHEQLFCIVNCPMSDRKLGFSHVEALHRTVLALLSGDEFLIKQIIQPVSEKLISLGEGATQSQVDSFKYQLQQVHDKLAVIGGAKDPKVLNLSASADEMKILDGCEWFVRQVAAIFNISTAKLKLAVDTSRANTSEMMADDIEALEGDLTRLIELENAVFIDRYKYLGEINLQFSYPILHRRDEKEQAMIASQQMGGQAWASWNESRSRTGEKALDINKFMYADEPLVNTKDGPIPMSVWQKKIQEYEKNIGKTPDEPKPPTDVAQQ